MHSIAVRVTLGKMPSLERNKHHRCVNNCIWDYFPRTGCSYLIDSSLFIPAIHNDLSPNHQNTRKQILSQCWAQSCQLQVRKEITALSLTVLWIHWLRVQRQPKRPADCWLFSGRILRGGQSSRFAFLEILGVLTFGVQFWPQLPRKNVMELQRVQRSRGMSCLNKEQPGRLGRFNLDRRWLRRILLRFTKSWRR